VTDTYAIQFVKIHIFDTYNDKQALITYAIQYHNIHVLDPYAIHELAPHFISYLDIPWYEYSSGIPDTEFDRKNPPPLGGFPIYYVP